MGYSELRVLNAGRFVANPIRVPNRQSVNNNVSGELNMQQNMIFKNFLKQSESSIKESVRARHILQLLSDTTAITLDIPIRILDIKALDKLPDILQELGDDQDLQKLYLSEMSGTAVKDFKSLISVVTESLAPDLFKVFAKRLCKESEKLFDKIISEIDNQKQGSLCPPTVEQLKLIETTLDNNLIYLKNDPDSSKLIKLRNNPALITLLFLLPFIEHKIWRTKISNPPLYHELGRMEPLWRLLVLCWFYQNRDAINSALENQDKKGIITKAIGLSHWSILVFKVGFENENIVCVSAPTFTEKQFHNQYACYASTGIYFKHCFLTYFSILAADETDRPEAEEVMAALMRRNNNCDSTSKERSLALFRESWNLILNTEIDNQDILNSLTCKQITLFGQWAVFLAERTNETHPAPLPNVDNTKYGIKVFSVGSNELFSIGVIADFSDNHIKLHMIKEEVMKNTYNRLSGQNDLELINDEEIWLHNSVLPEIKEKLNAKPYPLDTRFQQSLYRSRLHNMAFLSWRIGLLSNWLQRHFSGSQSSSDDRPQLLGDLGRHVCRLLRELTRADVGATIYQKDYGDRNCKLLIVADDSADQRILATWENRQNLMDESDNKNLDFLCYKSVAENCYIHESNLSTNRPASEYYPDDKKPVSIMIMPLHIEQRLLGVIEVKGSQSRHFRWSQRLLLQQVASVLAPYFYRQQLLHSLSWISRWELKYQVSDTEVLGNNQGSLFSGVCDALCRIFLCRIANIWLRSEVRSDRFILKGCSDQQVFCATQKNPTDNNIDFFFKQTAIAPDAETHFLQAFSRDKDSQGIFMERGKLFIGQADSFKVGRYLGGEGETKYHEQQGVIPLYADWVTKDPTGKRKLLFKDRNFQEVMAFPLIRQIEKQDSKSYEVLGFVTLHHDKFFNFSRHWRHTIRLVNDQIVVGLEAMGFIKNEDAILRRLILHEIKAEAINFSSQIDTFLRKSNYIGNEVTDILQQSENLSDYIIEKLHSIETAYKDSQTALHNARGLYKNLHNQFEDITKAGLYAFLGMKHSDIIITEIDMEDLISAILPSYEARIKKRGGKIEVNYQKKRLIWLGHEESVQRILQNLLDNACKYAIGNSHIQIEINTHTFSINNRCQFDAQFSSQWPFAPGLRGEVANKNSQEGWGYGLYLVGLLCNKILNWQCEFSQTQSEHKPELATFKITIRRNM